MAGRQIHHDSRIIHACTDPNERSRLAWDAVLHSPGLVRYLAKRVHGNTDDDTLSDCQIALYRALLYTDPDKGSVIQVARWYATQDINGRHGIHIPRYRITLYRSWRKLGRDPLDPQIDPEMPPEERVRLAWLLSRNVAHDHLPPQEGRPVGDAVETSDVELRLDLEPLYELLQNMSSKNRESVLCAFNEDDSLAEIGRRHGLSRERIRQIGNKVFHDLQRILTSG